MNALATFGRFGWFVADVVAASLRHPLPWRRTIEEAWRIGVRSLPILVTISFFVGTNLALQGYAAFAPMGGQALLGMFVALAGVRELAPIMVAAMVAAKAGTEMASQIAVMRIREQIDALEVMAVDPLWFLITPRALGIVLVLPALTVVSIFTVIASSALVAVVQLGEPGVPFLQRVWATTSGLDLLVCSVKAAAFGTLICLVSCYFGYTSKPGPAGVGSATNAAVVVSAVACAILNYFISELAYG
ncbi:MAG: ABC transporter permease [Alphaproteobacteria bacterium]|nr:ABC transporter permease [Alphaproteobacteria bacterium]